MHDRAAQLIDTLRVCSRAVIFTGAGISTESGIPDFRSPGGIWTQMAPIYFDEFLASEEARRETWRRRFAMQDMFGAAKPNAGHLAVAELVRRGKVTHVITQNIDGLHQKAGNSADRVIELHGTTHDIVCMKSGHRFTGEEIQIRLEAGEEDPHCPICGGVLRTSTILFGEALPKTALERALALSQHTDLMLVVGTSLVVNPAARLPLIATRAGARVAIINRESTPLDDLVDLVARGDAGPLLNGLADALIVIPGA
jgi:NAD-dependent deacetylase